MTLNKRIVQLGSMPVGDGYETVFMAEINSAFDHDLIEGKRMVKAAADAGCHFLKAEILCSTDIVLDDGSSYEYAYGDQGQRTSERWFDIVQRKMNPLSFYEEMFGYSRSLGLEFVVSVYDIESVEFLADMAAAGIKIPSNILNHEPIIRAAARTGIPLIFDTNKAYLSDIGRALIWAEQYGATSVVINHHPGGNPAPASIHNLNIIRLLKRTFNVPAGLSCHYVGDEILYTAVGVGVNVLEKPISFDPLKKDLDTVFAVHINDLPEVVRKVRACWQALGTGEARSFIPGRYLDQWMGAVARCDMATGTLLTTDNCRFAWPCKGVSVEDWSKIEGRLLSRDLPAGTPVKWSDVDFSK
jgi:YD repeat-containing protein